MTRTRQLMAACGLGLALVTALAWATPAQAGDTSPAGSTPDNNRYVRAQNGVDYVVYAPGTTFGLARTSFQKVPCGGGRDDAISSAYGSQAARTDRWIGLQQSPGPTGCLDGPDGVGPAATFRVNGAKVRVLGSCAGGRPTCASSTPALVAKQAYTTVTLPGSAVRPTPTFVEIYTQALTLSQIRQFVEELYPAA